MLLGFRPFGLIHRDALNDIIYGFYPPRIVTKHSKCVKVSVFIYADTSRSSWCVDIGSSWVAVSTAWVTIQMLFSSHDFIPVTCHWSLFQPPTTISHTAFYKGQAKRFLWVRHILKSFMQKQETDDDPMCGNDIRAEAPPFSVVCISFVLLV